MAHASESGENLRAAAKHVGLPPRPFLYTLDQLAVILDVKERELRERYLYFEGRSIGHKTKDEMSARNIAPEKTAPEWRVAEQELVRWMRRKGFRYYERSSTSS